MGGGRIGPVEREVLPFLAPAIRSVLERALAQDGAAGGPERPRGWAGDWQEIRLRLEGPLMVVTPCGDRCLGPSGVPVADPRAAYPVSAEDFRRTFELVSGSSVYALEEELRQGFITLPGGHRVGLCGRAVVRNGAIRTQRDIGSLNVRIAREVPGAADALLPLLVDAAGLPMSTLVFSPPGMGKTTLLRDLARQISSGRPDLGLGGLRVGVVDERSELGGSRQGRPTRDLGPRTDVLDGCPKAVGLTLLLRAMGPQVIVTDEVGRPEDAEALGEAVRCGVRVLASAHAGSLGEAASRPVLRGLLEAGVFGRLVRLGTRRGPGTVEEVWDAEGRPLPALPRPAARGGPAWASVR